MLIQSSTDRGKAHRIIGLSPYVLVHREWPTQGGAGGATVVACASATGTLHDEFVQTDDATSKDLPFTNDRLAQSWQSGSSPRLVTGVCLRLRIQGSPTGTFTVSIRAHSGTYGTSSVPTGADLVASAAYDVSTLTGSAADYFFAMSGWTPSSSTNYTVVLDGSSVSGDGSNRMLATIEQGAEATHGGNISEDAAGGSESWAAVAGDLAFKIYYVDASGDDFETRLRDGTYRRRFSWGA